VQVAGDTLPLGVTLVEALAEATLHLLDAHQQHQPRQHQQHRCAQQAKPQRLIESQRNRANHQL
jgi:hypothetical protein